VDYWQWDGGAGEGAETIEEKWEGKTKPLLFFLHRSRVNDGDDITILIE
jgi:hypothetical protein